MDTSITYEKLVKLAQSAMTKDSKGAITTYGISNWLDIYKIPALIKL